MPNEIISTTSLLTQIRDWVLSKIANITALIPSQASAQNQLADKAFVNSSIATATATHRGTYNLVSDLGLTTEATRAQIAAALAAKMAAQSITPDNNDYCFVQIPTDDATPTEIARIDRYKYNGSAWEFEYTLNNSGFTAEQWAAINSGVTSGDITKLRALPTSAELTVLLNGKQDVINDLDAIRSGASAGASAVQPSGLNDYYNKTQTDTLLGNKVDKVSGKGLSTNDYTNAEKEKLSGLQNYDDTQVRQLIGQKQDIIQDLDDIRGGAQAGTTAVQPAAMSAALVATVAKSGVYDVTANNDNTKFASLSALLSSENLDTLIPVSARKGGMSIKFVLSSDNKYVQYRLMTTSFSTTPSDWQGVDEEPTADSDNLVKSSGVYKHTNKLEEQVKEINSKRELSYDAIELIKTILSNAVFVSDQQSNIEELYKELEAGGGVVKTPVITLNGNVCTITCETENTTIRYTINGVTPSVTVGNIFTTAFSLDESCTIKTIAYTPEGNVSKIITKDYELSVDYIVFADTEIERVCLANFDSDGDGKISFEEAANVTSMRHTFNGNTTITKFHELKYFGVTDLWHCFKDTSSLEIVTLPSHLKTIADAAFNNSAIRFINTENIESVAQQAFTNCANLENINLDNCRTIGSSAFEKCTNMTLHSGELTLSSLGNRAFHSCANLNLRKISGTISEIPLSAFYGCTSITELELGEIQSIGAAAFADCSSLAEVKITGSTVPTIQSNSFPNTTIFYVPASLVSAYANAEVWNTIYNNGRIKPIND